MAVDAAKQLAGTMELTQGGGEWARERADEGGVETSYHLPLHPLFDHCIVESPDLEIYISYLSVSKHWVLNEHRIRGEAVLPGTAYLELARAAFESHAIPPINGGTPLRGQGGGTIEIREVYLVSPLVVGENEEKEVHTLLKKQEDGFEFVIMSQSGSVEQEHARGKIASVEAEPPEKQELKALEERCNEQELIMTEDARQSRPGLVEAGPRWKNLKRIQFGSNQGLATLELPEAFATDMECYQLHPALLDTATSFLLRKVKAEGTYLPFSYKKLKIKGPLPRQGFSYARYVENNSPQKETLTFHIAIMDDQGMVRVEIEGYTLRQVDLDRLSATPSEGQSAGTLPPPSRQWGGLQRDLLKEGLLTSEGVEVFCRILESGLPQVVVSTQDFVTRLEQRTGLLEKVEGVDLSQATYSRPELRTTYVPPRDETEHRIANIWGELLGVKQVGIHDNFFELGGHSLLATRVISRLREAFGVELPVGSLFEEATVADLARSIETIRWATQDLQAPSHTTEDREEIEL